MPKESFYFPKIAARPLCSVFLQDFIVLCLSETEDEVKIQKAVCYSSLKRRVATINKYRLRGAIYITQDGEMVKTANTERACVN